LVYVDDVNLLGNNIDTILKNTQTLINEINLHELPISPREKRRGVGGGLLSLSGSTVAARIHLALGKQQAHLAEMTEAFHGCSQSLSASIELIPEITLRTLASTSATTQHATIHLALRTLGYIERR
jgi:hypothetical protein